MKKIILFVLTIILTLSPLAAIPASAEEESNTEELTDYIAIKSEGDFLAMKEDGSYYLANDITISSSYDKEFSGTLHGNENEIKLSNNATPFKKLKSATITDLTVSGSISLSQNESRGGIANEGSASFKNVTSDVEISTASSLTTLVKSIGGFIGYVDATSSFINCTNKGAIKINSQEANSVNVVNGFGGFVGSAFTSDENSAITLDGCTNNAEIYSTQYGISVGGFVGHTSNISITMFNCVNTGAITGSAYYNDPVQYHKGIGGILGSVEANANPNAKVVITNVENKGNIRGIEELSMTGGIVGMIRDCTSLTFNSCKNSGAISRERTIWEGGAGIVGFLSSATELTITFNECSNSGHVKAFEAGGILGFVQDNVKNSTFTFNQCYNAATIESTSQYAGGMAGIITSAAGTLNFSKCVNTGHIEVLTNTGGGAGGIIGFIDRLESTTIDRCVNTGTIRCNNNTFTQVGYYCAAGIVSRFQDATATVSNCVNAGATSHAAVSQNQVAICYDYSALEHTITLNVYLNGTGNGNIGSLPFDFNIISQSAANALIYGYAETDYYSFSGIDSAIETIKKATTASDLGNAIIALLTKLNELQTPAEYLASAKQEKLDELGEKRFFASDLYIANNFKSYSNTFDEIVLDITSAEDVEALKAIKIKDRLLSAEALLLKSANDNEQENTTDTTDLTDVTDGTDTTESTPIATDTPSKKRGCASVISTSTAIVLASVIICGSVIKKKRK